MAEAPLAAADYVAGTLMVFNDNGAWSWYQDDRAIVDAAAGNLLIGSVSNKAGSGGSARDGSVKWPCNASITGGNKIGHAARAF